MPRSAKDNLEIREARRDEILEAAKRVFANKGFSGSKISEIASEAGLSHGLVYHYFQNKEAILTELVDQTIGQLDSDMEASEARAVDRIAAVITRQRAEIDKPTSPIRLVVAAALQGSLPEATKVQLQGHFARFAECQQAWIAEAQAKGDVDDAVPADQIVRTISFLLRGMCVRVHGETQLPLPLPDTRAILQLLLPAPRDTSRRHTMSPKSSAKGQRKRT